MQRQSILVIEDNTEMQILVRAILEKKYRVVLAASAREAYEALRQHEFNLLLVDIDLPDENGLQFCAQIKMDPALSQIPFVFLTSHTGTSDIVIGFSLGAEDYITKPIIREQFEARIAARMRNIQFERDRGSLMRHGPIGLDLLRHKAYVKEGGVVKEIKLTANEFRLLQYFLEHSSHVLSREQILNEVWGHGLNVSDRTVDTHIYTLRKKLGRLAFCIRTISGVGYQFNDEAIDKEL